MPLLRWSNPGHDTRRASSLVRGAGCREINLRIRRREKNVLDIPFYRSIVTSDALVNAPRALTLTVTVPFRPLPLLSVDEATAWFETRITTLPSVLSTGSTSTSALLVLLKLSRADPAGNICA